MYKDREGTIVQLDALINTSCTRSNIVKPFVERKRMKRVGKVKEIITYPKYERGSFAANKTAQVDLYLPKMSASREIEWIFFCIQPHQS